MSKKTIHSDAAPQAIGTYSQAVETNGLLFISGQIPLDPATMELVEGDFETRARRVFENLQAIATTAGATMDQAVKLTIYLTDLGNFASVNSVMAELPRSRRRLRTRVRTSNRLPSSIATKTLRF